MSPCYFFFLTFLAGNFNGSSSPSTGGFPLPTRARIRLTLAGSARRARSSKYSSVRIAETFFDGEGAYRIDLTIMLWHGIISR